MKGDGYLVVLAGVLSFCGICFLVGLRTGALALAVIGLICNPRVRQGARRKLKRPLLWLNAWRYRQSEKHICHLREQRETLIASEREQQKRQVKLQQRRNQIAGW